MARKDKHGGHTWVAVKERDEYKVRCRACSSVMYPRDWWTHACLDIGVEGSSSQSLSTKNLSKNEQEGGSNESS